ncbi:MAG: exosortase U [Gemmataceae bacterium]
MEATTPTTQQTASHPLGSTLPTQDSGVPKIALGWLLIGAVILLALSPLVYQHCIQMMIRPHYQFFPLAIVGALVLVFVRFRQSNSIPVPGSSTLTVVGFGLSYTMLLAAEVLYSSWLGSVAAIFTLASMVYAVGGARWLRNAFPSLVLLALIIPPPFALDRHIILSLKIVTTKWSSHLLDYLGVYHNMAGNVVEIPGSRLLVEDACSGINSFFSLGACTVFLVFFYRRHWLHAILLLPLALGWVLAANVLRVVTITVCKVRWGIDLSEGWRHEALGIVVFLIAVAMVWSTDRCLLFLSAPSEPKEPKATEPPQSEDADDQVGNGSMSLLPSWLEASPKPKHWLLAGAYVLAFSLHLSTYGFLQVGETWADTAESLPPVAGLAEKDLPAVIRGWNRTEFETTSRNPGSAFGELSKTWTYEKGGLKAIVSLDFPFPAWHDLPGCYTAQGWLLTNESLSTAKKEQSGSKSKIGYVAVEMADAAAKKGYLVFGEFNIRGKELAPRKGGASLSARRHASVLEKWTSFGPERPQADPSPPVYQFQVFVETYRPLNSDAKQDIEGLYAEALEHLLRAGRWD